MGTTILVAFALEAESDADTLYQSYHIKKDGIITHLHFDAVLASGGAVQFKIMRDQHSVQVWPEAPSPRSGDLIGDDFHFHDVYFQDLNLEVFCPQLANFPNNILTFRAESYIVILTKDIGT